MTEVKKLKQQADFSKEYLTNQANKGKTIPSLEVYNKIDDQRLSFNNWKLNLPDYAFYPDEWTESFQKGITSENFSGKTVYEVGLGTGANAIHLLTIGAKKVYGSDLDGRNPLLAGTNINENLAIDGFLKFEAFLGEESLLDPLRKEENLGKIEEIVACIPQAILPQGAEKHPDDKAHYYPAEYFDEYEFNKYALGLNEALLKESTELTLEANVTLNLGGRVGKEKLFQLFEKYGYTPEITHKEIIPQCPTTNLSFFVDLEKNTEEHTCEFFEDINGELEISAEEAEKKQLNNETIYHAIYVIRGIPNNETI